MSRVAAVVVRWRGGEETARCLQSLLREGSDRIGEIVLVDSGSGDGGGDELAGRFPRVRLLALPENLGFAAAANAGAASSSGERLLLLNPDTEVEPGAVERLGRALDADPALPGCVPLLLGSDGRPQHRWQLRRLPTPTRLALGLTGAPAFARPPTAPAPVPQPAAAAWLVRRSVWDSLDGLDPGFAPAWWEDVDLCARLAARGGAGFRVVPAARVRHAGGSSVGSLGNVAFLAAYHRNLLRYARRHHPDRAGTVAAVLRLALLVRAATRPGRRAAYLAARKAIA